MTARLQQSDQLKNAFIADATHELRTPLTVISGTIETLEDGALDDLEGRGPLLASMRREIGTPGPAGQRPVGAGARRCRRGLNLDIETLDLGQLARERCANLSRTADPVGWWSILIGGTS